MGLGIREVSAEEARCWIQLVLTIPVTPGGAVARGNTEIFSGAWKEKSLLSFLGIFPRSPTYYIFLDH